MPAVGFTAADFMDLFRPGAPWARAEAHVRVFKLYSQFISTDIPDGGSTDAQLRAVLAALNQHHIALGIEAGLLTSAALCGRIEGYTCAGIGPLIAHIKDLGGTLEYVGMDEPFLIDRYLAAETILAAHRTGHGFAGRLATYVGPVGDAGLRAYAIDDGSLAITTTASLENSVPAGAVNALVGLRINTECACDGPVNLWLGEAAYVDATSHRSSVRSLMPAYARVVLKAGQTALVHSAPFPVTAGDPFRFSIPMHVPYSSRNAGYVAIIFLDGAGAEIARMALQFRPGQRLLWAGTTDTDGRFGLTLPPLTPVPSIVRFDFSGSAQHRGSSTVVQ